MSVCLFQRTLKTLWSYLHERKVNTVALWAEIKDMVIKTILRLMSFLYSNDNIKNSLRFFPFIVEFAVFIIGILVGLSESRYT